MPKAPKTQQADPVPQENPEAKAAAENASAVEAARRKRGLASTILTSPQGVSPATGAVNTLLGQG